MAMREVKKGGLRRQGSSADKMFHQPPLNVTGPLTRGKGKAGTPKERSSDSHERPYNQGTPVDEWMK